MPLKGQISHLYLQNLFMFNFWQIIYHYEPEGGQKSLRNTALWTAPWSTVPSIHLNEKGREALLWGRFWQTLPGETLFPQIVFTPSIQIQTGGNRNLKELEDFSSSSEGKETWKVGRLGLFRPEEIVLGKNLIWKAKQNKTELQSLKQPLGFSWAWWANCFF